MITPKEYRLSDGSRWTAMSLGAKLGICHAASRYRLEKSTDVGWVMRPKLGSRQSHYNSKQFKLSDGCSLSARQIAEKYNINCATMNARLRKGITDVELLSKQPTQGKRQEKSNGYVAIESQTIEVKRYFQQRMLYTTEFDWALFMRAS